MIHAVRRNLLTPPAKTQRARSTVEGRPAQSLRAHTRMRHRAAAAVVQGARLQQLAADVSAWLGRSATPTTHAPADATAAASTAALPPAMREALERWKEERASPRELPLALYEGLKVRWQTARQGWAGINGSGTTPVSGNTRARCSAARRGAALASVPRVCSEAQG